MDLTGELEWGAAQDDQIAGVEVVVAVGRQDGALPEFAGLKSAVLGEMLTVSSVPEGPRSGD